MENILFTASVVAPVFLVIFVGILLKQWRIIDERFSAVTSKIVFNVAMPALLFQKLSAIPIAEIFNPYQVLFVVSALLAMFVLAWLISWVICKNGRDQGAFIQGAFRGNFAILGFALIHNAFGPEALANAALVLAIIMPLYNVLSIIALTVPLHREKSVALNRTIIQIITNPLIIAALIALPFSILNIPVLPLVGTTVDYLAGMTLPLALIGIGSALSFKTLRGVHADAFAAIFKIMIMPIICTSAAVLVGFRGQELGVLYFLFAAPAAIASYIMAEALGSNGRLAANIVVLSTMTSLLTISCGVFVLRTLGFF